MKLLAALKNMPGLEQILQVSVSFMNLMKSVRLLFILFMTHFCPFTLRKKKKHKQKFGSLQSPPTADVNLWHHGGFIINFRRAVFKFRNIL